MKKLVAEARFRSKTFYIFCEFFRRQIFLTDLLGVRLFIFFVSFFVVKSFSKDFSHKLGVGLSIKSSGNFTHSSEQVRSKTFYFACCQPSSSKDDLGVRLFTK